MDEYRLTKLTVTKSYIFTDTETAADHLLKSTEFKKENKKDVYQSFEEHFGVPGWKPKYLCELEPGILIKIYHFFFVLFFACVCAYFYLFFFFIHFLKKHTKQKQ